MYSNKKIFRHGQRLPTSFLTFPSEGEPPSYTNKLEKGELTIDGMRQEYELGRLLRSFYGDFMGEEYRPREINIQSGRDNRTLASAQLLLAGLFPPLGEQIWNNKILWQPIPIETVEILDHQSFGMFDHCPKGEENLKNSEGYERLEELFSEEIEKMERDTKMKIDGIFILQRVLDTIVTRSNLSQLPLPSWASNSEYLEERRKKHLSLHIGLIDLFLESMGGWHFDQILGRMDDAVGKRNNQKSVLYSAHDTNILTIGRFLGIEHINSILPDYASFLVFELQSNNSSEGDEHFVEIKFRNGLNGTTETLKIEDCPNPCPLSQFRNLRQRLTSAQWMYQCLGSEICMDYQCGTYGPVAAALLLLVVLLMASLLSVFLSCRSYKRNYQYLLECEENSPLIGKNNRLTQK
uniref:Prostatic acid phosphatase n=1 Tax=Meloidogyne hapla TaxID=6305 RepID=A0A1I8BIX5_MELHA